MTLNDAIRETLEKSKRPMRAKDIALVIERRGIYFDNENHSLLVSQLYSHINKYPSTFQNVNGYIILVNDPNWRQLISSYDYLTNTLRGIFIQADVQFIIAVLFYYRRLVDINDRVGRRYPLLSNKHHEETYENLLWGGSHRFLVSFKSIDQYYIAPDGIFEECSRLLQKLDEPKLMEVWYSIRNINTNSWQDEEFSSIYEYLITLVSIDNIKSSLNHTPYSLRQLMTELLNPYNGATVFDPVAGIGGLIKEVLNYKSQDISLKVHGTEINKRVAQLGNMNLYLNGSGEKIINAEDCFEEIVSEKKYDFIIGDLPANGVTNSFEHKILYGRYGLNSPKSGKSFGSLILFTLSKLKENGKAVLTVSDGFLIKKGKEQEIRKLLIDEDVIESIISLPNGTLRPYTDAKASLLILNKNKSKELKRQIQFIKASIVDQTPKSLILNSEEILDLYSNKDAFSKHGQIVSIEDLEADVNLLTDVYDSESFLANKMLKEGNAKQLGDIVLINSGIHPDRSDISLEQGIPLVKVENLSKDILDINANISNCEKISNSFRYDSKIISQECILVARIGDSLKSTIFRPSNEVPSIIPHSNIYALIPLRTDELNLEYLYYQLHSSFIQGQIDKRKLGAVMPYVSISRFKETIIPIMSLDAQNEFVHSQKANLIAEERGKIEARIKALGYQDETKHAEADIIKTLTHQLRPVFSGLNDLTKRVIRITEREKLQDLTEYDKIELNNDPDIETLINQPDNYSLSQLLEKLAMDSKHLSEILTNVDKVMNFRLSEEDLEPVEILDFFTQYKIQKDIEDHKNYSITVRGDISNVLLHCPSFKELIDQLLFNAEKHAFGEDPNNSSNAVQFVIRLHKKRNVVSIEYSNNGKQYELTQKDFTTAFEKGNKSKGSGIGGNYIYRIVEAHKGKLLVDENRSKGFSLTIELPLVINI